MFAFVSRDNFIRIASLSPSMIKGRIISGSMGDIQVRQKADAMLEIGELLIAEGANGNQLLQVTDLSYGSQLSSSNREMIAGMALEEDASFRFYEPHLRNYMIANAKSLITINNHQARSAKYLPHFFTDVRSVEKEDFTFLARDGKGIWMGDLRSGSQVLDVRISLPLREVISHHILIPATTGKGKSNLMSHLLWGLNENDGCGMLVFDPHDEYYGKNGIGLKDHPKGLVYYSPSSPPPGQRSLRINLEKLEPAHFSGVVDFSSPQVQCLQVYHQQYGPAWIANIFSGSRVHVNIFEDTLSVVQRKLSNVLSLSVADGSIRCRGIFTDSSGESTMSDIIKELADGKTVIVDTSHLSGQAELLVSSVITNEVFAKARRWHSDGEKKPVIGIVLEEAPRVLGKDVLERGSNIFSSIAREGRKFGVGLCAITQLPSLIPKEILANMNTKIILGIEMAPERQAIIESAAQDLSTDNRNIASLDKGEAIITSNFARFATPIYTPLFKKTAQASIDAHNREAHGIADPITHFSGLKPSQ